MYKTKIIDSFSAAHRLNEYHNGCERLHGHNYRVEVTVGSDILDRVGMVMDFRDLKQALTNVLKYMDHQFLNDLPIFDTENPSAEHIARHIFSVLKERIALPAALSEVVVWENDTSCAAYQELDLP